MSASAPLKNPTFGHKIYLLQILFCFILHLFYCCVKSGPLLSEKQKLWSPVGNDRFLAPLGGGIYTWDKKALTPNGLSCQNVPVCVFMLP